jgi:hypothetical protein
MATSLSDAGTPTGAVTSSLQRDTATPLSDAGTPPREPGAPAFAGFETVEKAAHGEADAMLKLKMLQQEHVQLLRETLDEAHQVRSHGRY